MVQVNIRLFEFIDVNFLYFNRSTYQQKLHDHAGMTKKPLGVYDPNSKRSKLPVPTIVMPYKNSSQIVIGDRSSYNKLQFRTTNQMHQGAPNLHDAVSNGGIIAQRVKWVHNHQTMQ